MTFVDTLYNKTKQSPVQFRKNTKFDITGVLTSTSEIFQRSVRTSSLFMHNDKIDKTRVISVISWKITKE